jgi:hypothetical protein
MWGAGRCSIQEYSSEYPKIDKKNTDYIDYTIGIKIKKNSKNRRFSTQANLPCPDHSPSTNEAHLGN